MTETAALKFPAIGAKNSLPVNTINRNTGKIQRKDGAAGREPGFQSEVRSIKNPFHMPKDEEVFALRDREREERLKAKEIAKSYNIYQKSNIKRQNFKDLIRDDSSEIGDDETVDLNGGALRKRAGREALLLKKQAGDRQFSKETLQEFVAKKREMFLVQYALGIKKEEMKKLEEIVQAEEQRLLDDEKALEEDAAKFDAFLKENDKNSVEAMKKAETETKAKLEKMQEIKKLNAQIIAIRSEMSKNEDQLKDFHRYRAFLEKLTPSEWLNTHIKKRKDKEDAKNAAKQSEAAGKKGKKGEDAKNTASSKGNEGGEDYDINGLEYDYDYSDDDDLEEEAPLFFNNPQQLLDIFAELEENNLSLIQNCQEMEETLEELKQKTMETEKNMDKSTQGLRQQIEFLENAIRREEDKAKALEERSKLFSNGAIGNESQEKLLKELHEKVKEVYQTCIGDYETNVGALQMLTSIENKLEQLFEVIEMMPIEKVEQAEKMKDKERRQRIREEKMDAQRLLQEERVQRALERAKAPVKKKTGKPLVFRSAPPQKKKKQRSDIKKKEEEDLEFYFKE